MKRKVLALLLALSLSVGISGCTNMNGYDVMSGKYTSESTPDASTSSEVDDDKGKDGEKKDPDDPGKTTQQEWQTVLRGMDYETYYVVDQNGRVVKEYKWSNVLNSLMAADGTDLWDAYVNDVRDGMALCYNTVYNDGVTKFQVYAVDLNAWKVYPLWTGEGGNLWLRGVDYFEGKFYVTVMENGSELKEYVYENQNGEYVFTHELSTDNAAVRAMQGFNVTLSNSLTDTYNDKGSITRTLAENGYVLGLKDSYLFRIMESGERTILSGMDGDDYIQDYDKNGIIYKNYDLETGNSTLYYLDLSTGAKKMMLPAEYNEYFLAYDNGKAYFYVNQSDHFVLDDNLVYQYDVNSGECRTLYGMVSTPGALRVQPGIDGFRVKNGTIFIKRLSGNKIVWAKADANASGVQFQNMDIVEDEISVLKWGSVLHYDYSKNCEFCGIKLLDVYEEAFQLDPQYSDYAEKINEYLKNKAKESVEAYQKPSDTPATDEECEWHQSDPYMWRETNENEVNAVEFLSNGKYMTVDYDGYWYGGGAHGYPFVDQVLFDMETGDVKTLADFYDGSDESFRKLVADKTVEDFESYDEGMSPYFASDSEEIYKQAYESVSLENCIVTFKNDGIYVSYPPYVMGPYAAGSIDIFISYEELLGRHIL